MYSKIARMINQSRPGVDPRTPWPALSDEHQREMDQALAMLREAADQGHMGAQAICGDIYRFGEGVAKDERLDFVYTEKAAQQGHSFSQHCMGYCYQQGTECKQSFEKAAEWYQKAARQGRPEAMTDLAALHYQGEGVPQSLERAIEWWRRAASEGQMIAQYNLAQAHEHGKGVAKDYSEARRLYKLASAQGHAKATKYLNQLEEKIRTECPLLSKRVVITGTTREDFNGRIGVARSFDEAKGRYVVRLEGHGELTMKIKPENLKCERPSRARRS